MSTPHPDIPAEQRYVDYAASCLKASQKSARRMIDAEHTGWNRHAMREIHARGENLLRRREEAEDRICFARIDREDGGPLYLGREVIRDSRNGTRPPLVINWAAPAANPYFEAHPDDRQGIVGRRTFDLDGLRVVGIDEEVLAVPAIEGQPRAFDGVAPPWPSEPRDALLRELEKARSGEMRDIVPTIEREQFALIRADREGVLVVQGGPGTGKTAVALHRAAWLAYNHYRERSSGGVLVVGPNPTFMQYVASVLPGLGEQSVTQSAVDRLVVAQDPGGRIVQSSRADTSELAFLKGDPRMADVVTRCVDQRVRPPTEPVQETFGGVTISISVEAVARMIVSAWGDGRRRPYMEARTHLRRSMRGTAQQLYGHELGNRAARIDDAQLQRALNAPSGSWFNALERIWPTMSAPQLVHELYTIRQRMREAAGGVLEPTEQSLLMRSEVRNVREQPWSTSDLSIVDEADAALNGGRSRSSYGYVIVDEAQDLTPMQLRMVGRRAPAGALTLVGDLAQTTGPWTYSSWSQVVESLPYAPHVEERGLRLGYRVPEPIIRLASTLLPRVAPTLEPVEAVRPGRAPVFQRSSAEDLPLSVAAEADSLRIDDRTVGVIVPSSLLQPTRAAAADVGLQVGDIERDGLARQVTLLPADAAKGLEFDHVVVVEPAAIVRESSRGFGELYVALTRATQALSVVHSEELPAPMSAGESPREPAVDAVPADPPETPPSAPSVVDPPAADLVPKPAVEVPIMDLGGDFSEALIFAKLKHGGQARRGMAVPYLSHLLAVAALVLDDGGTEEDAIAALLHDAAEDHGGTAAIEEIASRFGDSVAGTVAMCTDPSDVGDEWRAIKEAHLETLATAPAQVRRVSLAEKLENARTIVRNLREIGPEIWPRMGVERDALLWYYDELAEIFGREHPGAMAEELGRQVEELKALSEWGGSSPAVRS